MQSLLLLLLVVLQTIAGIQSNRCSDNTNYSRSCGFWKSYCSTESEYFGFMKVNCQKTCGLCPVDGGYSGWSNYGECSVSCGGGTKTRSRQCNNPTPKNGGKQCSGPSTESTSCNTQACTGTGASAGCQDDPKQIKNCPTFKRYCAKGNKWYQWMQVHCSKTCGFCTPKKTCQDDSKHSKNCPVFKKASYCTKESKWHPWMRDHCSKTCGFCKTDSTKCGARRPLERVIGGVEAPPNSWPWSAALLRFGSYFCGGSLIDSQWVLTAAHCLYNRESQSEYMEVVLGEHDRTKKEGPEKTIGIEKIINHPQYSPRTLNNDISLIKLKKPVSVSVNEYGFADSIGLVCLPKAGVDASLSQKCYLTGWGKTKHPGPSSNILMETELPLVSNAKCKSQNNRNGGIDITSNMICAGKEPGTIQSGCHGDSGGPLVCTKDGKKWTLTGVVSWGSSTCDRADKYTVFARVSNFINWIEEVKKTN